MKNLSELQTKRKELFEYIKDLKHQISSELGNVHDRWCGYKVLKESSCEAETQKWDGKEVRSIKPINPKYVAEEVKS